jgi:hypothetical protein
LDVDIGSGQYQPAAQSGCSVERGGQEDPGRQIALVVGAAQYDPSAQSFSTVDPAGQYDPDMHAVEVAVFGQT